MKNQSLFHLLKKVPDDILKIYLLDRNLPVGRSKVSRIKMILEKSSRSELIELLHAINKKELVKFAREIGVDSKGLKKEIIKRIVDKLSNKGLANLSRIKSLLYEFKIHRNTRNERELHIQLYQYLAGNLGYHRIKSNLGRRGIDLVIDDIIGIELKYLTRKGRELGGAYQQIIDYLKRNRSMVIILYVYDTGNYVDKNMIYKINQEDRVEVVINSR